MKLSILLSGLSLIALTGCATAAGVAVGTVAKVGTTATSVAAKTAVGGVKLGARGAGAVLTSDPRISKRTLARKAAETIGVSRSQLEVSDIYQDINRTDYRATIRRGGSYRCAVIEVDGEVSDAACAVEIFE